MRAPRALLLVAGLCFSGCHDDGPTAPRVADSTPRIGGAWTGTVQTLTAWDPWDEPAMCTAQPVTLQIVQDGQTPINGTLNAPCVTAHFKLGKITNNTLRGTLDITQDGIVYSAILTATLEGSPVSRISADTTFFSVPVSGSRKLDSIRLALTR